jgi:DNA-binding LacI/PurR family transcriptional regulator
LAREHGISRMTMRRASELLINEGLVERRPGKGLYMCEGGVMRSVRRIQVVAGNLGWEPSLQVSRGVQDAARDMRILVQLYDAHGDTELDLEMLRQLPESPAQGAVIMSLHSPAFNDAVCRLATTDFPFVLADQRMRDLNVPSVTADNYSGGYQAARHLILLGHTRIAFVGDLNATTVQDRLAGMRDAIADAGLPFIRSLVADVSQGKISMERWMEFSEGAIRELLSRADRPTAVFTSCDAIAYEACRVARSMSMVVPEDLSVVGFDDAPLAHMVSPSLTTIRQPFEQMGCAAIELLAERMSNPQTDHAPAPHRVLPVELVVRQSTARRRTLS